MRSHPEIRVHTCCNHISEKPVTSPYNATFFSPLFLGAYDGQDTPGDCAVGARPQRRGSPQSYTPGGASQLGITGGAAPPSALVLFSPKRPCKCQRKKWASIVSNMW